VCEGVEEGWPARPLSVALHSHARFRGGVKGGGGVRSEMLKMTGGAHAMRPEATTV
jgi:hypothetical protein